MRRPVGNIGVASARIPPRGYLAPISLPLRAVAWCENASPVRTGAAASAAAARTVGGGREGGRGERWRAEGVFFLFPPEWGFVNRSQRVSPWAGRTFFLSLCAQGRLLPERKLKAAGQVTRGVGDYIAAEPARAGRGQAGGERGGWVRPQAPRGRRREAKAASARPGHERPVSQRLRLLRLRGNARAAAAT